jgi:hypothetical protein
VIPRTDVPRRAAAALVLAFAAVLPLAGCDAVQSLTGASGSTTTTTGTDPGTLPDTSTSAGSSTGASTPAPDLTLPPLDGYRYTEPPKAVSDQLANIDKQFNGVFTATSARGVARGNKPVAAVVRYGVDAGVTGTKEFDEKLLDSMLSGLAGQGAVTKREVLENQPVVSAFPKQGTGIVAWYHENVITIVLGADPAEARGYAQAYLKQA